MAAASSRKLTALDHFKELRWRLGWSFATLIVGGFLAYFWRSDLIKVLQQPLKQELFYMSPTSSFEFVMKICLLGGFLLALPVFVYNILRFIEPAFRKKFTKKLVAGIIGGSFALTLIGVTFAFMICLPIALNFFNEVGTENLKPMIAVDRYFSFVFAYVAIFAAIFQAPLLMLFIDSVHPLDPPTLGRGRKWVIVGSFGIALLLPVVADPLSQSLMALPVVVLYEISILLIRWRHYRQNRRLRKLAAKAPVAQPQSAQQPEERPVAHAARPSRPQPAPAIQYRPVGVNAIAPRPTPARLFASPIIDLREAGNHFIDAPAPVPVSHVLDLRPDQS